MVKFIDHLTGDVLVEAENGEFEFVEELFFKFRGNYIEVIKRDSPLPQKVVDLIHNGRMKVFDMWRVEKDIFDVGEKLGELVEKKMDKENADFTYMVDYIFNLRAWYRAHRQSTDMKVYIGPSSTYMANAYVRNFTPIFVREEDGVPFVYIFKETVFTEGLIEEQLKGLTLKQEETEEQEGPAPPVENTVESDSEEEKEEEKKEEEKEEEAVPVATPAATQ
ncbi:unnamed protein product [Caenorhabditis sp. 36 PRJEB53466]|nr:unnamed protein product [Caenorhabditis sp. 36 PRJEB53466]